MEALKAALKEVARLVIFALVSFFLTAGVLDWVVMSLGGSLSPDLQVAIVSALTLFFRGLDKYIHKDESIKANGLLPW